jgi:hypothetical protein
MKKEITRWISSIEDIATEEAVNEFYDGDWDPRSWEYTYSCIDSYIEEFEEISDEEKDILREEIKKEFSNRVNELRQEEVDQLKDKKSILNWIENLYNDWPDEGEVGYLLSKEEILDLILQNGNK